MIRLLIRDASVLIGLIIVDHLATALSLLYVKETTDFVRSGILRTRQQNVLDQVIAARRFFPATLSFTERPRSVRFPCTGSFRF